MPLFLIENIFSAAIDFQAARQTKAMKARQVTIFTVVETNRDKIVPSLATARISSPTPPFS
jgi:hypothetical protein